MAMSAAERRKRDRESPARKKRNASPAEKKRRAARNKARRKAIREGKVKNNHKPGNPGRKPEIDHKKKGAKGGTRVMSHKKNRGRNNGPLKGKK